MYEYNSEHERDNGGVEYVSLYDPFVFQTLQSILGRDVVVETTRGSLRGELTDVKPDHIAIQSKEASFFIRTQEIVWVMPK